jgi:5'-3' exonuclease
MILIADGLNVFLRAYAVVPTLNMDGIHVGGLLGFFRSIKSVIEQFRPTLTIVTWDGKGGSRWRRGIYNEYKQGRKPQVNRSPYATAGDSPEKLKNNLDDQIRLLKEEYLPACGMPVFEFEGFEADDLIAVLCMALEDKDKIIVSSDKDFLQLVRDKTKVYSSSKKKLYDRKAVIEEYDTIPENLVFLRAIAGDKSDNIGGIKGIGEKSVPKLFPFLKDKIVCLSDLTNLCVDNKDNKKTKKYVSILHGLETLRRNIDLMQLKIPNNSLNVLDKMENELQKEHVASSDKLNELFARDRLPMNECNELCYTLRIQNMRNRGTK